MCAAIGVVYHAELAELFRAFQLPSHFRGDDGYRCSGSDQRECLTSADDAAANNHGGDPFTMQRDREIAHRNWPRLSDAMRKTTDKEITLAKRAAHLHRGR